MTKEKETLSVNCSAYWVDIWELAETPKKEWVKQRILMVMSAVSDIEKALDGYFGSFNGGEYWIEAVSVAATDSLTCPLPHSGLPMLLVSAHLDVDSEPEPAAEVAQ